MKPRLWMPTLGLLGLVLLAGGGCDALDRARGAATDTAGGVTLNLESPGTVEAGGEAVIRLNVWNRGDTAVTGVRAELFLPAWLEPLPPRQEGTAVTMVASGEGTQVAYEVGVPPLPPGESRSLVQPVRVPAERGTGVDFAARTLRAWLVGPDGQPLGIEVSTDLAVTGWTEEPGEGEAATAEVGDDGVGGVSLGMTAAQVRQRFAAARDTSWSAEGMTERGLVVPLDTTAQAPALLARLHDGRVDQLRVRGREVRTAEGLGVGSTLGELRAAYGDACAGAGEGTTVVWFAARPGVSFVLDAPPASAQEPARIPDGATVTELFVRSGQDGC